MKGLLCLLPILLFFNCKKAGEDKAESFLEVYYMAPRISTPYDYSCGMISEEFLKDELNYKKITDKKNVEQFIELYDDYKASTDSIGMNIRIKVVVHQKNNTDTLCMGEHFNTYKNGVKMVDNIQLLTHLKKVIDYDNTISAFVRKHPERYKLK